MNKRIIIVGGGASVRQGYWHRPVADLTLWNKLIHEATISLNYTFKYFDPTIACFHDETFYRSNLDTLKHLPLIIGKHAVNVESVIMPNTYLVKTLIDHVDNQWEKGFYGSNLVGVLALSLAINLGYTDIYLLGYDFGTNTEYTHFYQDEVDLGEKDCNNQSKYRGMGKRDNGTGKIVYATGNYENPASHYFAPFLPYKKNVNIINVGESSNINEFYKISYEEFYQELNIFPGHVNQEQERNNIEMTILEKTKHGII